MRFATLAALVSGGAASAIPAGAADPLRRRITDLTDPLPELPLPIPLPNPPTLITFPSPSTCASYVTVTESAALLTETATQYVTAIADTVTSTQISTMESTLETTNTAVITQFETSFVTETATVATETATQVITEQKKKRGQMKQRRGDSCKRRSSSSQASVTSSSATSTQSADVCTATVTASALKTTTTVTVTGSATATDLATVTSVIVATITTTVSTTDLETTAVPTTLAVTATTFVTAAAPPAATPTFVLKGRTGNVINQYVTASGNIQPMGSNFLTFTPDVAAASAFTLKDGAVVLALYPDHKLIHLDDATSSSFAFVASAASPQSNAACQLIGETTAGSEGSFTCPNGGSGLSVFAVDTNNPMDLMFESPAATTYARIELDYVVLPLPTTTPPRTPAFTLTGVGGTVDGQVLRIQGDTSTLFNSLVFSPNAGDAALLTLRDDGSLVPASLAADPANYAGYIGASIPGEGGSSISITTAAAAGSYLRVTCQLSDSSTDVGSTGLFTCPNQGARMHITADYMGYLMLATQNADLFEQISVRYNFVQ
ncbi:hypothetical protein PG997_014916 [Apiospora hydei]|uniref:Ubiquitin 3 binding protein But2 C-terminal domain-containing protein n=1 Tax=Apiospora hydei TaxID=1337664 RepID=A0ABR1UV62_9PEZI